MNITIIFGLLFIILGVANLFVGFYEIKCDAVRAAEIKILKEWKNSTQIISDSLNNKN